MEKTTITGRKLQMSQIFMDNGRVVPVTVVKLTSATPKLADNFLNRNVVVTGKSKGKGFAGGIKRWGFRKQGETRGASNKVRAPGAIGSQTPGRVFRGKKMAGHKGNVTVTIRGLKIVNVNPEMNQIMVSGPIPGARNSEVFLNVGESVEEKEAPITPPPSEKKKENESKRIR
jgi:ribosomal protein L3